MRVKFEIEMDVKVHPGEGEPYEPEDELERQELVQDLSEFLDAPDDLNLWLGEYGYNTHIASMTVKELKQ